MTVALVTDRNETSVSTEPGGSLLATEHIVVWGVAEYRDVLRWPVGEDAEGLILRLGCGVGAVEFPAGRGREVVAVLRVREMLGPVLVLPGRGVRWVFLTAPDDPGAATSSAPMAGARLRMSGPDTLVLPPLLTPHGPVRWIVPPSDRSLRLPRLRAVLSAAWQSMAV